MDEHKDSEFQFDRGGTERYRDSGECPNCGSILLDKGGFNRTMVSVERKVECAYCGIVFYSTYKFEKLIFDGWMYGSDLNGRGKLHVKGQDHGAQQSGGSDGHANAKVDRSKRSTLGGRGRSTKKRRKTSKRKLSSKKDKGV